MSDYRGRILIVDDDPRIRRMLKDYLENCSFLIMEAKNGEEALDVFFANNSSIDLVLLDVMMPGMDGFAVLKELRNFSEVPVIFLSAKSEEYDQLQGFRQGADDYISKPFAPKLLLAHIEAVLKRCFVEEKSYTAGELKVDIEKRQVKIKDDTIDLTPKEYELLLFFLQNKEIALSRETILNRVWNYDYVGDLRTVDTHIKQLRAKLTSQCPYIKTVHGFGYRFEV